MNVLSALLVLLPFAWFDAANGLQAQTPSPPARETVSLQPGVTFRLQNRTATIRASENLPHIESDYTRRFKFDSFQNPKLRELRYKYRLDDVIAPGTDEFDQQVLLMDWTHHQFKRFGTPSTHARGALEILNALEQGHRFFCAQYAELFASSAASLGWVDRELALRRHQDPPTGGSSEHSTTEIWSNQHRKWVMLDPTSNLYIEKDGVPLNAFEIREEWFYRNGTNLVFVVGKDRKRHTKSDLPIFLGTFAGFGDLVIAPDELDKYGFIGYIPNTDFMDARQDYAQMFITKDKLCEGTPWHRRLLPPHPASDPYFPINQAALSLNLTGDRLAVHLKTLTPNFKTFEARLDGGDWKACADPFPWPLHSGTNRVEARSVNQFGVAGPPSTLEVALEE